MRSGGAWGGGRGGNAKPRARELFSSPSSLCLAGRLTAPKLTPAAPARVPRPAALPQPRSSIFAMFDDLLLMAEGRVAYAGPAAGVLDHFAGLGHPCPEHYNPAGGFGLGGGRGGASVLPGAPRARGSAAGPACTLALHARCAPSNSPPNPSHPAPPPPAPLRLPGRPHCHRLLIARDRGRHTRARQGAGGAAALCAALPATASLVAAFTRLCPGPGGSPCAPAPLACSLAPSHKPGRRWWTRGTPRRPRPARPPT
jgi:hypothetical protein